MVSETAGKLMEGLDNKSGKKAVKYSLHLMVFYLVMLMCLPLQAMAVKIILPEVVIGHLKRQTGHHNIYILDRGLQSGWVMKAFNTDRLPSYSG